MTLVETVRSGIDSDYAAGLAIVAAVDLCARWSLQPCTERSQPKPTCGVCRHCVAMEILTEIGRAIEVYP